MPGFDPDIFTFGEISNCGRKLYFNYQIGVNLQTKKNMKVKYVPCIVLMFMTTKELRLENTVLSNLWTHNLNFMEG